jgi:hypothetical protein
MDKSFSADTGSALVKTSHAFTHSNAIAGGTAPAPLAESSAHVCSAINSPALSNAIETRGPAA